MSNDLTAEHDACTGCKYEHFTSASSYCQGCKRNAVDKYTRITNADRVRAMTNKELAEFLLVFDDATDKYNYILASNKGLSLYGSCDSEEEAKKNQLEWLESEVDDL